MSKKHQKRERYNILLLILILIFVFGLSPFPSGYIQQFAYSLILTGIFIITVFAVKKSSNLYFYLVGIVIVLEVISDFFDMIVLQWLTSAFTLIFFVLAIVSMMIRISKSKEIGSLEFLEAINIYFLMGILGSVFFQVIYSFSPASFRFPDGIIPTRADFVYYSFVTISTLGYGDIIPVSPFAKNMSIFVSISGQLYLAMIVAMLVGKYLSAQQK